MLLSISPQLPVTLAAEARDSEPNRESTCITHPASKL